MGFFIRTSEAGLRNGSTYTKGVLPLYFGSLNNASQSGDYKNADDLVESIKWFPKEIW
jgi:hypothetical protein